MNKTIKTIIIIFCIFLFLIPTITSAAPIKCEEKYPGDGQCVTDPKCPDGFSVDSIKDLCPETYKCCHQRAQQSKLTLQVPLLGYTQANSIAEYIGVIYEASLYIIIPFIIVMIIFSGLLWVFAAGDKSIIQKAKSRLIHSFIGLGIALFSYVILSFIGITSISTPEIAYIEHEDDGDIPWVDSATGGSVGGSYPSIGGSCFPVAANSFSHFSWNWGSARRGGARCHGGVDLYTKPPGHAIVVADGVVTNIFGYITCGAKVRGKGQWGKHGGATSAIMIYHPSLNHTILYGEVDTNTITVKRGQEVTAGLVLGIASGCNMLHFELYSGKMSANQKWYPNSSVRNDPNGCAKNDLNKLPSNLKNPNPTLKGLQGKMCGN